MRDLPAPGIELMFPALASGFFTAKPPRKPHRPRFEDSKLSWK